MIMAFSIADGVAAEAAGAATAVQDLRGEQAGAALERYQARIQADPKDWEALKGAGIILHQLSRVRPEQKSVADSERYLKQAHALRPQDMEIDAWLGSVTTMKALFESDPGKKTFFVKMGTRMLDKAVKAAPDNTVIRLTRAYNSIELPAFLMRTKVAVEDFKYYLRQCRSLSCPSPYLSDAREKLAAAEKIVADNF